MLIKYMGKDNMSYTNSRVYEAKRLKEEKFRKDHFAVYDDDKDWFRVSGKYIQENFQIVAHGS